MAKRRQFGEDELYGAAPKPPSILRQAGGATMSGLSAVGNLLDLPGSSVRDVIAGQNPIDQYLSPFRDENRTSGRDLLRQQGMVGRKDTYGNFAGGLGAEVLLDPLTYLSGGTWAVGKGIGSVARKAGIHGLEAARIATAASKGGKLKSVGKWVGPREARLTLTGQHIKDFAPEAFSTLESTANAQKGGAFDLAAHMNEPLGALAKFWPLGDAGLLGTGQTAQKVARGLDVAGDFVRHAKIPGTAIRPVGDLANLVNRKAGGATNAEDLQTAYHNFNVKEKARYDVNLLGAKWTNDLVRAGHRKTDAMQVRDWFEFPQKAPPEVQPLVQEVRDFIDKIPGLANEIGAGIDDVTGKMRKAGSQADYFMRQIAEGITGGSGASKGQAFNPTAKAKMPRMPWTHGSKGGTKAIAKMAKDPQLEALMPQTHGAAWGKQNRDAAAQYIELSYGHNLPATFEHAGKKGGKVRTYNTYKAAARSLAKLSPEVRKAGIYANHPLNDFIGSAVGTMEKLRSGEVALRRIMDVAGPAAPGNVPIKHVLRSIGLQIGDGKTGGAAKWLADRAVNINDTVPADTARFLTEASQMLKGESRSVNAFVKLYDDIANVTKAAFTNLDPVRFNVRNRASGAAANALSDLDNIAAGAASDANRLVRGEVIPNASQNQFIQEEAAKRNIQGLDDARATEILREMLFAREATGSYGVAALPQHGQSTAGSTLEDLIGAQPGGHPFSWGQVGSKLMGKGTTWNPFSKWRGVGGAEKSTFAPLAAGEDISHWTESMNRIAPMWALMQNGVHPDEAIKRVLQSQVAYQGRFYTPFEQQFLKRVMLFYSFSKGQIPFTLQQLLENPGGRLAQTLRAINSAKDDDDLVPQHIAETAAVPVPELPGMQPLEEGAKRYITGFGMGFEDPAQFAVPSFQNLGLESMSRMNQLLKGPLEAVTGQSFFQRAPGGGGRSLEDLDPALGRTLANVRELTTGEKSKAPVRYPGSSFIEHMLSNSPLSNVLTKARTATDPRKGPAAKGVNLLTGVKATDVSPAAQDRELRNRINQLEKEMGGRSFTTSYLPDDVKERLSPKQMQSYLAMQQLEKLLQARSEARKKK